MTKQQHYITPKRLSDCIYCGAANAPWSGAEFKCKDCLSDEGVMNLIIALRADSAIRRAS